MRLREKLQEGDWASAGLVTGDFVKQVAFKLVFMDKRAVANNIFFSCMKSAQVFYNKLEKYK